MSNHPPELAATLQALAEAQESLAQRLDRLDQQLDLIDQRLDLIDQQQRAWLDLVSRVERLEEGES